MESTTSYSDIGPDSGYGYMWWTGEGTGLFPTVDVGGHSYRASGFGGQELIILPEHNLVVVHRADTSAGDLVSEKHIGVLLWMILDASGKSGSYGPPIAEFSEGERLSGGSLEYALLNGKLSVLAGDGVVDIMVKPGGEITIEQDDQIVDSGQWHVEGEDFCLTMQSFQGVEQCGIVIRDDEQMKFYDSDGFLSLEAIYDKTVHH